MAKWKLEPGVLVLKSAAQLLHHTVTLFLPCLVNAHGCIFIILGGGGVERELQPSGHFSNFSGINFRNYSYTRIPEKWKAMQSTQENKKRTGLGKSPVKGTVKEQDWGENPL